ncbi:MAG: MBL fold metallo-hydrolase [Verrucomicrobiae bacterium]|nr:MBL fold metallo-hydrolase [Verrucomicrobiae bacterium]
MSLSMEPSAQNEDSNALVAATLAGLDPGSNSFRIEAQGSRWEPLQGMRPDGPPLHPSDFDVVAMHDPGRDRMRLSWQRFVLEPLKATVAYDEIVVGNEGYIAGGDVALGPQPSHPMKSDRLAAVCRLQQLLNPQLLVGDALRRQRERGQQLMRYVGRQELDGVPHHVVEIDALPRPISLYLDLASNHVSRLVTQEHDFPCGDVEIAVVFSDWRNDSGLAFPYLIELSWDGVLIHRETRRHIELNPSLDPETYVLPETEPFDPEAYERGLFSEQWVHRSLAMSAPFPLGAGKVITASITPTIVTIAGGIHHSLAIALDSGVVVVDPPLHEDRSLEVIAAINEMWPDKPITHLVLTHHHHDHSGGIRAYAAIGAELIVAEGDRDFVVQRCLARPHTIRPDTLALAATQPTVHAVGDNSLSLGDGEIHVHRISSPHSAEDLVVYVASAKLLFNADLFNPGLVRPGGTPPPDWLVFSRDFRKQIEALNLDIEILVGAHGVPQGGPYQELINFTE